MLETIDWSLLTRAKDFYTGREYQYVETPWIASDQACGATFVTDRYKTDGGQLVASGEQGLLQMAYEEQIHAGKWMTISPCFRFEPEVNRLHQLQFMKLELMVLGNGMDQTFNVMRDARDCFAMLGKPSIAYEETREGYDICRNGIELGSYGYREAMIYGRHYCWTYGTGLALPRFTQV